MALMPHFRRALLCGTALVTPTIAFAQIVVPNAAPVVDRVVAGGITVSQDAAQTRVTQAQQRGIVDWRSFNVGRDHHVQFQQPSSSAITLNRVTTPDPSVIAGRVSANGQIAIVNQSGVVFTQGSQVEAAGLIVSSANITNENFLAGRMVFNQPGRPDARIENAGTITIREAGLAALVAPQVANRGAITARMGRVALAGAETHVVDLYGDGLMSIDVTGAVRRAPDGGVALVTNTGVIEAQGGRIQLTAAAADGIVTDLLRAGGRISADTDGATGRTGQVTLSGTGGAIRVEGEVNARGMAAGTRGGRVEAVADRVLVDRTGRIDASGRAGGGEVAIGTTVRGARNPRLAQRTGIAQGAVVRADATERGNGGTVIVNSSEYTAHGGTISARGGPQGGDGGFVEVSGQRGLLVLGQIDVGAPAGASGDILFDPTNLTIIGASDPPPGSASEATIVGDVLAEGAAPSEAFLRSTTIEALAGNVRLEATNDISVNADVNKPTGALALIAGRNVTIEANRTITLSDGQFRVEAGGDINVSRGAAVSATVGADGTAILFIADGSIINQGAIRGTGGGGPLPSNPADVIATVILEAAGGLQNRGGLIQAVAEPASSPNGGLVRIGTIDLAAVGARAGSVSNLNVDDGAGNVLRGTILGQRVNIRSLGDLVNEGDISASGVVFGPTGLPRSLDLVLQGNLTNRGTIAATGSRDNGTGVIYFADANIEASTIENFGRIFANGDVYAIASLNIVNSGEFSGDLFTSIRLSGDLTNGGTIGSSTGPTRIIAEGLIYNQTTGRIIGQALDIFDNGVYASAGAIRNEGAIEGRGANGEGADTLASAVSLSADSTIENLNLIQAVAGPSGSGIVSIYAEGDISNSGLNARVVADVLDARADRGSVSLLGVENRIGVLRSGFASAAFSLQTSGDLHISGSAFAGDTLDLRVGGDLTQSGNITAAVLQVTAGRNVALNLGSNGVFSYPNGVDALGPSTVGGDLSLRATCPCDEGLTPLNLQGAIQVGGRLALDVEGGVRQLSGSTIQAGELFIQTPRAIDLLQGDNAITRLVGLRSDEGGITLRNTQSLTIAGPVSGGFTNGPVRIDVAGGDLTVDAAVQGTDVVRLSASGNLTLTPNANVYAQPSQSTDPVIYLQAATATFGVDPRTGVDPSLGGTLTVNGRVNSLGGTIWLGAGQGGIVQEGDAQGVGFSSGRGALGLISGGDASLHSAGNAVDYIDHLDVSGAFLLENGSTHLQVRANGGAAAIGIRTEGILQIARTGALVAPGDLGRISLQVGDFNIEPGGRLAASTIEIAPRNQSGVILGAQDPFSVVYLDITSADLTAINANTLRVGAASFDGPSTVSASLISIEGPVQFGGNLDLHSLGEISQIAGAPLTAGLLTGSAGTGVLLDRAVNAVSSLGSFSVDAGDFRLSTGSPGLIVPAGATVNANGALVIDVSGGGLVVDGTVRGTTTRLAAASNLTVNGLSAIATAGDLLLDGFTVTLNGLAEAMGGNIIVQAVDSASLSGVARTPSNLLVEAPTVTFAGLDASSAHVDLLLGGTGTARGSVDARELTVRGGSGALLTGTIGGIAGATAAVLGRRATAEGIRLSAPPFPANYTFNGCPISIGCPQFVFMPLIEYPEGMLAALDPANGATAAQRLRPPMPEFSFRPLRDRTEEQELAPPDVRRGDY